MKGLPLKGTLLNTITVIVGSILGLSLGSVLPNGLEQSLISVLGLITLGQAVKLILESKDFIAIALSLILGSALGTLLGIQNGLEQLATFLKSIAPGASNSRDFVGGFLTASVLFCVGPMTILGCIQDGIEKKSELLQLKSLLDGVAAIFLSAATGFGVLASAVFVLIFQGVLTLLAQPLNFLRQSPVTLREFGGVGGFMMLAIGLNLLQIKSTPVANMLPAVVLVVLFVLPKERKIQSSQASTTPE